MQYVPIRVRTQSQSINYQEKLKYQNLTMLFFMNVIIIITAKIA